MRLYSFPSSPFSRKVRIAIAELGLNNRVEILEQNPTDNSKGYYDLAVLGQIPALERENGDILIDSPLICEYLNAEAKGDLVPASGEQRWEVLRRQSLGDGCTELAQRLRREVARPDEKQDESTRMRNVAALERIFDRLERDPLPSLNGSIDLGTIAVGCAIGWIAFRLPNIDWRVERPKLAGWLDQLDQRKSFHDTQYA